MQIGFCGLGRMGGHMARHLAAAGHELRIYDLATAAMQRFEGVANVTACGSWGEVAQGADVVFTSLPGPKDVEQVVLSPGGLRDSMPSGSVYIDVSTNSPSMVRSLEPQLAEKGIAMLDAPVSGGVDGAEAATLSIMVGGDEAVFERMKPVLSAIGTRLFYCGSIGAGSVTKLCNNYCSFANAVSAGEALTLASKPASMSLCSRP